MVFSLIFCWFFGVSFTCVAFRVNFANVCFTSVKLRFVRNSDDLKYVIFLIFRTYFACLFLHAFSKGFGEHFGKDLGYVLE